MRQAGACCPHGTQEECVQSLDGESEGKRLIERPGDRRKYITMDLRKTGWDSVDWIHLLRIEKRGGLL
jgi:hypothetical protein